MANDTPALVKSYQFQINKGYTASGTVLGDVQNIFYNLKNYLCTLTAHAATVVMSSNSIVSGAADYYTGPASIIANSAGSAHSWVVLKFATLGNMQLLIDHNSSSSYTLAFSVSFAGFTGGNTTTAPIATDQKTVSGSAFNNTSTNSRLHITQATDGSIYHVILMYSSVLSFVIRLEAVANVPTKLASLWTNPYLATINLGTTAYAIGTIGSTSNNTFGYVNGAWCQFEECSAANSSGTLASVMSFPDDDTGEYPFFPITMYTPTASHRGFKCGLIDQWHGLSSNNMGDNYPSSTDVPPLYQFVQFGNRIIPWDGASSPLIA